MAAGDNPRFVVTSLADPPPQMLYEDLYTTWRVIGYEGERNIG
jgi:hypothetical protein